MGLTGAQGGWRDLDLTGCLVGLEGRGSTSGANVCGKQIWALSPRGAGAGSIASVMGLLFVVHCYQLEGQRQKKGQKTLVWGNTMLSTILNTRKVDRLIFQRVKFLVLKKLCLGEAHNPKYDNTQWDNLEL